MTARVSMDSRIDSDQVQFANMEDTDYSHKSKSRIPRWISNTVNVAIALSLLSLLLVLATILGAAIKINSLSDELETLKSQKSVQPTIQQQRKATAADSSAKPGYDSIAHTTSSTSSTSEESTPNGSNTNSKMVEDLKVEIEKLKAELVTSQGLLEIKINSNTKELLGTTYTRWGKRSCPADSELLYTGFAAGSSAESNRLTGGGANYLCLPTEPEWNKYDIKNDTLAFSWLYAAEYLTYDIGIYSNDVHGHTVTCSVCKSPRTSKVTIPARRSCPYSWTMEYEGYLMSSYVTQNKMTFECVDAEPDVIEGTQNVTGGAVMYFVSGYCGTRGGLGYCPPYVPAREITCVLCTK